ncbi:MAG TPA: NAD(P)-dependent glycerol-3-phosphate dehydrogenase [Nitrospirae bacterium]|nr:glycerol-3-phosphate dehydrogenase [NAD(P)+] [bacterium BMS3Abin10]GBE38090.1 glycerol-3-phosphate dehydrogenase [NAD(P)+] [bacterium BMS3Bbin08]HDH00848.1 NAD(P)-dependent glycerol-3-phosphate dehydrogenase [Nitrospirota bacterium]
MSYIAVIGGGSWGTTLAGLLADKEYDVSLWVYEQSVAEEIQRTRVNSTYLPEYVIPDSIKVSHKLEDVVKRTRYVLNVVPAQYTRAVFKDARPYIHKDAIIINASKGIERGTLLTVSAVLKELFDCKVAALSGPSFASEVIKRLPTAVTIAAEDDDTCFLLQEIFNTDYFRVYTHTDITGVEIGGALKNVMAIASGISDGLGLGASARAALITRGLVEITRLGKAMGAHERTFMGLSGLGDLVLTCTGQLSRNHTVGVKLGQGLKLQDIVQSMKMVAEGVATSEAAYELSKKYNVEMPIVEQIYKTINEDKNPADAVKALMGRTLKSEF